jgi:hypothetical protein
MNLRDQAVVKVRVRQNREQPVGDVRNSPARRWSHRMVRQTAALPLDGTVPDVPQPVTDGRRLAEASKCAPHAATGGVRRRDVSDRRASGGHILHALKRWSDAHGAEVV